MGIFKDTYIFNTIDTSSINEAIHEKNKILKENTKKEINARDRVDIQLSEYLEMKEKIKKGDQIIERYEDLYNRLASKLKIDLNKLLFCEITKIECYESAEDFSQKLCVIFRIPMDDIERGM